ncbi:MAG: glycine cleavage system aminomethyltransferase GcvT [Snowella sp.]|nr:glycine cleavage system aminomethyltransferase GcvT [Snowella sp.]
MSLARTPLYAVVLEQKPKMTAFSGWEMPVQFTGLKQEHAAIRNGVGMFDISHMGKFVMQGQQVFAELQKLVPSDLSRLTPGRAQYTVLLNEQGGIIDDIIIYHQGETETGEQRATVIVNAGTKDKDKDWLLTHLESSKVNFADLSAEKVLIAIQGPNALATLQALVPDNLGDLPAFGHLETTVFDEPAFIARTGYTGEDGFEVMTDPETGEQLWRSLLGVGVIPCGLGARDTLRLEAAMCLYGQDIDDNTTPLEAGLGWLVHLDTAGDFIGRAILEQQKAEGVNRRLVGIEMEGRHIARHGYPVVSEGKPIGEITSGTQSPTLEKAIALAYVPSSFSKMGQTLEVEIRGKAYPATVVKKPFYKSVNKPK